MLGRLLNKLYENAEKKDEKMRQVGREYQQYLWDSWNERRIYRERISDTTVETPPGRPRYVDPGTCLFDYGRMEYEARRRLEGMQEVDLLWRSWNDKRISGDNTPPPVL